MFFRDGKQLPWFKVGASRKRRCKERDKLAAKVDALAEVCDASSRAQLVEILADTTGVTFSSELLRALCGLKRLSHPSMNKVLIISAFIDVTGGK
jgi:hypothetical protein